MTLLRLMKSMRAIILLLCTLSVCTADDKSTSVVGSKADPWVSAAPLMVAAVCQNGVALVALHNTNNNDENVDENDWTQAYQGPVRIAQIDSKGSALVCAGWRPDADWLTAKCKSLAANEAAILSTLQPQDVSLWMAQCAASGRVRALSVVGLLSLPHRRLYLVDATGAYAIRAHAVGRGAKLVNARLSTISFQDMTAEKGVQEICQVLSSMEGEEEGWQPLSNTTHVELACVDAETKKLQRIRQPFLVAASSKKTKS